MQLDKTTAWGRRAAVIPAHIQARSLRSRRSRRGQALLDGLFRSPQQFRAEVQEMKCAKCGSETNAGENYTFYYGTQVGSGRFDRHTIFEHLRIAGQENVFLCHRCAG